MTEKRFENTVKDVLKTDKVWVSPEDISEIATKALHLFCGHDISEEQAARMAIQEHGYIHEFDIQLKFKNGDLYIITDCPGLQKKSDTNVITVADFPADIMMGVQDVLEKIYTQ